MSDFISRTYPDIAEHLNEARHFYRDDKARACLTELRIVSEKICRIVVDDLNLVIEEDTQHARLTALKRESVLPGGLLQSLFTLKNIGNAAAHGDVVTIRQAEDSLRIGEWLCEWFDTYLQINPPGQSSTSSFQARHASHAETNIGGVGWKIAASIPLLLIIWFFVSQFSNSRDASLNSGSGNQIEDARRAESERIARQQQMQAEQERRRQEELRQREAREQEQQDERLWNEATRAVNSTALRQYLSQYPNGKYASEAQRRLSVLQSIRDQFDIRQSMVIRSNSSYDTQVFIGSHGGAGVVKCALFCSQNPYCRAFTSDDNSCRIYNSIYVETGYNGEWHSGFRRN